MQKEEKATTDNMWASLEKQVVPKPTELKHLSGLLDEDIARFNTIWVKLALETRKKLSQTLMHLAEANFEMDFSAIFRLALTDPHDSIRAIALEGLIEDEDIRLISKFTRMLFEDESPLVRTKAAQALANFVLMGELQKLRPIPFEKVCSALTQAHTNPQEDLEVQRRALESLAYTNSEDVFSMITKAYAHEAERMRVSAVFAMGRSADKRWEDIVYKELRSVNPEMRYEATRACGELGLKKSVALLIELVEDVDIEVQLMALWSLGQIGGEHARRTLKTYENSDNEALSDAAKNAFKEFEFLHGDFSSFFGAPEDFYGAGEIDWDDEEIDELINEEEEEEEDPWIS